MEIITIESSAYKELVEKIDKIAGYVRENERAKKKDAPDVWLRNEEVMSLLGVSRRTLQRLRENGRIGYAIFRGACRYPLAEVERLIGESTYNCIPKRWKSSDGTTCCVQAEIFPMFHPPKDKYGYVPPEYHPCNL